MTVNETKGKAGCLVVPGILLVLGIGLALAGYFAGDTTAYNRNTGQSGSIAPTLYILGGVFGGIGLIGVLVVVFGGRSPE